MPLMSYSNAVNNAASIKADVQIKKMPPKRRMELAELGLL